jgi:hypothetical protein
MEAKVYWMRLSMREAGLDTGRVIEVLEERKASCVEC